MPHFNTYLVDHNELAPHQDVKILSAGKVNEIIDHHKEEMMFKNFKLHVRNIQPVASCATLVFDYLCKHYITCTLMCSKNDDYKKNMNLWMKLLLGPILLDTINGEGPMTTNKDLKAIKTITTELEVHQAIIYDLLVKERYNVSDFTPNELLRMDFKQYETMDLKWGISSVRMGFTEWMTTKNIRISLEFAHDEIGNFMAINGVHYHVIMFSTQDGKKKHIAIGDNVIAVDDVWKHCKSSLELTLSRFYATSIGLTFTVYTQENTNATRKQVYPAFRSWLEEKLEKTK